MYTNFHSSVIHNINNLKELICSSTEWISKLWNAHKIEYYSLIIRKNSDALNNMDKFQKSYAEQKEPDTPFMGSSWQANPVYADKHQDIGCLWLTG